MGVCTRMLFLPVNDAQYCEYFYFIRLNFVWSEIENIVIYRLHHYKVQVSLVYEFENPETLTHPGMKARRTKALDMR